MKQKTFMIHYKVNSFCDAEIKANSLEEALTKAREMTSTQLDSAPGAVIDEEIEITGVFE